MRLTIQPQLEPSTYLDRKGARTIAFQRVDAESVAVTCQNFDPLTGQRLADSITQLNDAQIDAALIAARGELTTLQDRIHNLEMLQRDLTRATAVKAVPISKNGSPQ